MFCTQNKQCEWMTSNIEHIFFNESTLGIKVRIHLGMQNINSVVSETFVKLVFILMKWIGSINRSVKHP